MYIVWCAAAAVSFVGSSLPCSTRRRLVVQPTQPSHHSAFAQLTNGTPATNDLIVAIRCDMVHRDETFDICNPSSPKSSTSSIVQRDARLYDQEVVDLFSSVPSSAENQTNVVELGCDEPPVIPEWVLQTLTLAVLVLVFGHTSAIALSTSYMSRVTHGPRPIVTVLRTGLASLALLVCAIALVAPSYSQCAPHPLLTNSAIVVYAGCLLEPCVWAAKDDAAMA